MLSIGLVAVVMIFSVPILAIILDHRGKSSKLKNEFMKDQIELERLKQENFIAETKKLQLELKKMELELQDPLLLEKKK
ncbi:hypothetical protein [Bacillus sp. 1P06AnD]|uniref:hypothetical protein n=1 Tax=Bacillus sp. 1P06AnD TaxID=3132208 RepID=UPI0039A0E3A2